PIEHPHFVAAQWLLVWGIVADGERALRLEINPDLPLSDEELIRLRNVMEHRGYAGVFAHAMSWNDVCAAISSYLPK
ncbi:MAG: hypothetical protein ACKO83_09290, partial [Roseiflexaceae bacterium]